MKNLKKLIVCGTAAAVLSLSAMSVFAQPSDTPDNPAQITAEVTGRSVESIIEERKDTGKSFAQIADEAGKLDEFKADMIELRKARLDEAVAEGRISQQRADAILADMKTGGDYGYEHCYDDDDDDSWCGHRGGHHGCGDRW